MLNTLEPQNSALDIKLHVILIPELDLTRRVCLFYRVDNFGSCDCFRFELRHLVKFSGNVSPAFGPVHKTALPWSESHTAGLTSRRRQQDVHRTKQQHRKETMWRENSRTSMINALFALSHLDLKTEQSRETCWVSRRGRPTELLLMFTLGWKENMATSEWSSSAMFRTCALSCSQRGYHS